LTTVTNDVSTGRQALRRAVNTRLRGLVEGNGTATIDVFCECGRVRCAGRMQLAAEAYDAMLESPRLFVVVPGHENDAVERIVERREGLFLVERETRI
jgi:hypothetical protein